MTTTDRVSGPDDVPPGTTLAAVLDLKHTGPVGFVAPASKTASMRWVHRPPRADDGLHDDQLSTWAGHGRAVGRGPLFDRAAG